MAGVGKVLSNLSRFHVTHTRYFFNRCHVKRTVRNFSVCPGPDKKRRFSEKHEWVTVEGNIGTVGISYHAQDSLGDIVYVQLPEVGMELEQNDECGAVESVKAASELYTPLSGRVTDNNKELEKTPGMINSSCYKDGWIFKIELKNPAELNGLMDEDAYNGYLKKVEH